MRVHVPQHTSATVTVPGRGGARAVTVDGASRSHGGTLHLRPGDHVIVRR